MSSTHYHIVIHALDDDPYAIEPAVDVAIKNHLVAAIVWQQAMRSLPGGWRTARWHDDWSLAGLVHLSRLHELATVVGAYVVRFDRASAGCCSGTSCPVAGEPALTRKD